MLFKFSKCVYTAEVAIKADYRLSVRPITAVCSPYMQASCLGFAFQYKVANYTIGSRLWKKAIEIPVHYMYTDINITRYSWLML